MVYLRRRLSNLVLLSSFLAAGWAMPAAAQVKLEHKRLEGRKTTLHTTMNLKQVLSLAGMNLETNSDRFVITTLQVGKRSADGNLRVDSTTGKMTLTIKLPGGMMLVFDSDDPSKKADIPQLEPILELLRAAAKARTTMVFDKQDELVAVEGLDKASEGLSDDLKGELDPERAKKAAQQELKRLPTDPVKPGDTWSRNSDLDLGSGQVMSFTTEYKYVGEVTEVGKKFDKIESKTTAVSFTIDQNSKLPLRVAKSDLKPTESMETMLFDRAAGEWQHVKGKVRIQGDIEFTINGTPVPGKLDLTIEAEVQRQQ